MATEVKPIVESSEVRNIRLEVTPSGIAVCWHYCGAPYGTTLLSLLEERIRRSLHLTLEVPHSVRKRLERLLELCEAESPEEVIRRALATYETLLEQQANGSEVVIRLKESVETPPELLRNGPERVLIVP